MLILIPLASAAFTVETELVTNSVCPTNTILIQEIVTSQSNAPYSVTISGPAAAFTTAVPSGFYLEAGQKQTIYLYITPPSTTMPNAYNLLVNIESQGTTKQLTQVVNVENCHSTSLTVKETVKEMCSCDETDFVLTLENKGKYLEQYELSVNGYDSSWFTLSPSSISLLPGNKADILAHLKVPCGSQGDYETTFNVKGKNSIAQASAKTLIKVYPCYDFILSSEKNSYEVCENKKLEVPLTIKNTGTQDNIYQINYNGPIWTNVDKKDIEIKKGESGIFNILASPPLKTTGEFTASVEVMSRNGKVIKKQDIKINSVKCYDFSLSIPEEKQVICNGLEATYAATLKNLGKFTATYDVNIVGPDWVKLSENKVTLDAGKDKSLSLTISPPQTALVQDYIITIKATDTETKIISEDTLTITTASLEQCYQPSITSEKETVEIAQDHTATAGFMIENKGTKEAIYDIVLTGTASQFSQINPGAVTIAPSKAQNLYLYIAPSPEIEVGTYTATVTARLKDTTILASKTISIKVVEKTTEEPPVVKPTESLFTKIINFFKNLFTIKKPATTPTTNETITPTEPTENETEPVIPPVNETIEPPANETQTVPPAQEPVEPIEPEEPETGTAPYLDKQIPEIKIAKDSSSTVDLDLYFKDPNSDKLYYAAVSPLNMTLKIDLNKVTVTPDTGFQGERKLTFYASDGKEAASSNEVKITVGSGETTQPTTPALKINLSELLVKYRYYLIGAAIIIIIIIILLSGLGEKIVDFFEEDVEETPKAVPKENNKNGGKKK